MKKVFLIIVIYTVSAITGFAQNSSKPCATEEFSGFNFWLGTWELSWKDEKGELQKGKNVINKILNGCVIEENFSTAGDNSYIGKSHSVFDSQSGKWKQTWVDSNGSYLDFVGEFKDGKMTLWREFTGKLGKKVRQRMVFSNIQKDSFEWNWESSLDEGKTWKTIWKIFYRRQK